MEQLCLVCSSRQKPNLELVLETVKGDMVYLYLKNNKTKKQNKQILELKNIKMKGLVNELKPN